MGLTKTGPLYGCVNIFFRYSKDRRTLPLQVLPGSGGQDIRDKAKASLRQGPSREARVLAGCKLCDLVAQETDINSYRNRKKLIL